MTDTEKQEALVKAYWNLNGIGDDQGMRDIRKAIIVKVQALDRELGTDVYQTAILTRVTRIWRETK